MRFLILVIASPILLACSPAEPSATASTSNELTDAPAACAPEYWSWYQRELQPAFERPIGELSEAQMDALVATHPPIGETKHTYGGCWQPMLMQGFFVQAMARLHEARVGFAFAESPTYRSLPDYEKAVVMTPEMRRNARAVLMLKPSTMSPTDVSLWVNAYDAILAPAIEPVGVPGLYMYMDVKEEEWILSDADAEYLAILEAAASPSVEDGGYREWFDSTVGWILGPPPMASSSFVFRLAWEQSSSAMHYDGLEGVVIVDGAPVIPAAVQAFLDRRRRTMPAANGDLDSSAWMSWYRARGLRLIGDLSQNVPQVTKTDFLALDVLESMRPAKLRGAFAHESWADLVKLAKDHERPELVTRFEAFEPCVDACD